jgi:hypothetical protein
MLEQGVFKKQVFCVFAAGKKKPLGRRLKHETRFSTE